MNSFQTNLLPFDNYYLTFLKPRL